MASSTSGGSDSNDDLAVNLVGVEPLVEPGGAGQVPCVDQHVRRARHVDGCLERQSPGRAAVLDATSDVGVVERAWIAPRTTAHAPARVVVDRGDRTGLDAERAKEEARRRQPLDQVTDDVAGDLALAGRRVLPRRLGDGDDSCCEALGHLAEPLGDGGLDHMVIYRVSWPRVKCARSANPRRSPMNEP